MTSIKPPSGPLSPGAAGLSDLESATGPSAAGPSSGAQGAGPAAGVQSAGSVQVAGGERAADAIAELAAAVQRGEITGAQAAEQLVERAVAGVGHHLSAAERAELTAVLMAAFEGDPALRSAIG